MVSILVRRAVGSGFFGERPSALPVVLPLPESHDDIECTESGSGDGDEDGDDDDDDDDGDDDDDEDMRRILAFANRSRASGSGLPASLATLNRVVETADSSDQETAERFMSGVAGVLRDQRTIQESVALVLEQGLAAAESPSAADGVEPQVPLTEEQLAFSACLSRLAAFKKIGATRLDPTITQGVTPECLERQPKKPSLSLRRKLMVYQCELDVYAACTERGILYTEPEALFLHPDVVVLGLARVVERGTIGPGNPRTH
ncbi:hypothetical protein BD413DRAFT_485741 [Trametes elegans]|nr:hypothetical protein BD413DRAFT_485741 [Trametes elegans]